MKTIIIQNQLIVLFQLNKQSIKSILVDISIINYRQKINGYRIFPSKAKQDI